MQEDIDYTPLVPCLCGRLVLSRYSILDECRVSVVYSCKVSTASTR